MSRDLKKIIQNYIINIKKQEAVIDASQLKRLSMVDIKKAKTESKSLTAQQASLKTTVQGKENSMIRSKMHYRRVV
jgi:hypothetical protein